MLKGSLLGVVFLCPLSNLKAEMPDDTIVYREGNKKRVHVKNCKRYQRNDPADFTQMTWGEAKKFNKKLDFCSKCPVLRKGETLPESWVNPPPPIDEVVTHPFTPNPLAPLVSLGSDGRLVYKAYSEKGDQILDWSTTGYKRSEVPIPEVPVKLSLTPPAGNGAVDGTMKFPLGPDSTQIIQDALDQVGAMPADEKGVRGALFLEKGTWYVYQSIKVPSGVVLRGAGDSEQGTVIIGKGWIKNRGGSIIFVGSGEEIVKDATVAEVWLEDSYVPSGSTKVTVSDASAFQMGDMIDVKKTVNQRWVDELGMGERLRHIRGGFDGLMKKPWIPERYQFSHIREITGIDGNTIHLSMPLPQSFDLKHGGGKVVKVDASGFATHCAVESLLIKSDFDTTVEPTTKKGTNFKNYGTGVSVNRSRDSWVKDVTVKHINFSAVNVGGGSMHVTVRDCTYLEPIGVNSGGYRYAFHAAGGTGHLFYQCHAEDSRHCFVGGTAAQGPFAFVNSTSLRGGQSEPHLRWGSGFLYDNISTQDGRIAAINRGDWGTGHGWAAVNTLVWNGNATGIIVFDPETEGENNFAIGYTGPQREAYDTKGLYWPNTRAGYWGTEQEGKFYGYALSGNGYIESPDKPVEPRSLFTQQLIERIGKEQAMKVLQ